MSQNMFSNKKQNLIFFAPSHSRITDCATQLFLQFIRKMSCIVRSYRYRKNVISFYRANKRYQHYYIKFRLITDIQKLIDYICITTQNSNKPNGENCTMLVTNNIEQKLKKIHKSRFCSNKKAYRLLKNRLHVLYKFNKSI